MLVFESMDADKFTRIVSPVYVEGCNITTRNVLNSYMDHHWDGFYTSLRRLSRFPTLFQGGKNMYYNITTTGTVPNNMRFSMRTSTSSMIIRIKYSHANAFQVYDYTDKLIAPNAWDGNISAPSTIRGDYGGYCGENRYLGVVNILEVYMSPGCNFTIKPIDSIQTNIRMNWTLSEFYASGGTTQFQDRVAASLGISVANVKIVSVYTGSVVVEFQIMEDSSGSVSKVGGLNNVQETLGKQLSSNKI